MILFKKIRWKNFLSTGNVFTEIDLASNKTTLIVGENGAGKSTLLDALSFVLFNRPFRKVNKPQLMNTINKKDLVVEIEFSIGKAEYRVVRGIKPGVFELYKNDVLLNQDAESKDYQKVLEDQILKINHKSFAQVVVLGSASFVPFMQLPAGQRREVIEDLLDLQIFTTMNTLLKDKLAASATKLTALDSNTRVLEERIKLMKEHRAQLEANNEKMLIEKNEKVQAAEAKIADLESQAAVIRDELEKMKSEVSDKHKVKDKLDKLKVLEGQITSKRKNIEKSMSFFHDTDTCPTCSQGIDHDFKNDMVATKSRQLEEIDVGINKLNEEKKRVMTRVEQIAEISDKIMDATIEFNSLINQKAQLTEYIADLTRDMETVAEAVDESKIVETETELEKAIDEYNAEVDERSVLAAASAVLKDGGIKAKIIKQYVPIINKLINKYLSAFELFCKFELDEHFEESIKSRHHDEFSYASFSEGEKQKIDLAILFTWRAVAKLRNSIHTNLLIMDEIFDSSLDVNGTDYLLKVINEISGNSNVFIISHKDQMHDRFEKTIKFIKHKNFSRIDSSS